MVIGNNVGYLCCVKINHTWIYLVAILTEAIQQRFVEAKWLLIREEKRERRPILFI
jgi:hypothetical protein